MPQFDMPRGRMPALLDSPMRRLNPRSGAPKAAFVSQLIADHYSLTAQHTEDALRSYDAGIRIALRRMPAGYRMKLDA
jgi:hypothetical protein